MTDNERKGWQAHLPAILTAGAAFLAALTTIYVNIRNDLRGDKPEPPKPAITAAATAPATSAANTALLLQLQRIEVIRDGTYGTTDWSFRVEADGRELFELPRKPLNDRVGDNIVTPTIEDNAQGRVLLLPGQQMLVKVIGEGGSLIDSTDAIGTGTLTARGISGPLRVRAKNEESGSFVFHFVATPVPAED